MFNEKPIIDFLKQQLQRFPTIQHFYIAYSGGVDSTALLHLLVKYQTQLPVTLHAIHIHHGLYDVADQWQQHAQTICNEKNIPLHVIKVNAKAAIGESVEAKARQARYHAFEKFIDETSVLLLAHHQDDQAETVLLQLFRGAGIKGLAAMPDVTSFAKGFLFRPFLQKSRSDILSYAMSEKLTWVYDISNDDKRFERNFLRQEVMPLLKSRWPSLDKVLARTANLCAETDQFLQEIILEKLKECVKNNSHQLSISTLKTFSMFEQTEILRAWFKQLEIAMPNQKHLKEIFNLINAKQNANPLVCWKDVSVKRYRETLFVHNKLTSPLVGEVEQAKLARVRGVGHGISLQKITSESELTIQFRNQNGKRLKKIFQQYGIPPWQRSDMPLIFYKDKLIAVVGVWIHPSYKAKKDEMGIEFSMVSAQGETI